MKETSQGETVVNIVKSNSVVSLGKEYLELGLDAALESGALKDIPFVNTVVGLWSAVGTVKDRIFAVKLVKFLSQLSEIPLHERMIMVDKLNQNDKFSGRTGTVLIEILDRMESDTKPELAAKCFAAYAKEMISFTQLRHILHAIERVPTFEISGVAKFAVAEGAYRTMEEVTLLSYVNAGLAVNNGGLGGGAIIPTELCRLMVSSGVISSK